MVLSPVHRAALSLPPAFIYSCLFTVISSLSPPSFLSISVISAPPLPHFPFHHFALLLVFLCGWEEEREADWSWNWSWRRPLHICRSSSNKQCELAVGAGGDGGDAGGSGGLAAAVVAITAVVAEQEAGRMISSR